MDQIRKRIDKWYLKFRQCFFKYSNGFYELPFLVNSPEVMIQGFVKMPFARYEQKKQLLSSNNPFMKSELIHLSPEKDLILFLSQSKFKKNLKFKFLYDKNIPSDHYFLRYQITRKDDDARSALSNGIPYTSNTWLFYKPGCSPDNYYFQNTSGVFFTIYFTREWLDQFLSARSEEEKKGIEYFLESEQEYLIYPDELQGIDTSLFVETISKKPDVSELDLSEFKCRSHEVISGFISSLNNDCFSENYFSLTNNEQLKIIQAESHLKTCLGSEFPGIEYLSELVGIAQTSLKNGFKQVYGKSPYKYYQAEKMQLAARRLSDDPDIKILQLALEMGYENPSKFSAAFRENIGLSPSEYLLQLSSR